MIFLSLLNRNSYRNIRIGVLPVLLGVFPYLNGKLRAALQTAGAYYVIPSVC